MTEVFRLHLKQSVWSSGGAGCRFGLVTEGTTLTQQGHFRLDKDGLMERVNDKAVVFLPWDTIEAEAQHQILNTAAMPFVFKHVAVMPDCHYGKGATVGTVLATDGRRDPRGRRRRHRLRHDCRPDAAHTRATSRDPAAVRAGIERRIPMSAGKNNAKLTPTAADRVETLEPLAHGHPGNSRPVRQATGGWRSERSAAATTSSSSPKTATAPCG